jgi:hypothetical protein
MLDTKKFRTKLTIGTTIVDSDENTQSGYEVNLKISHFQIVTEKIQNS